MADRFVSAWSKFIFLYQKSDYSKRMVVRQVKNKTKRENPVGSSRHRRGALAVVTHICSTHQMLSPTHHPYLGAPDISDVYLLTLERPDAFDHIIHIRKDQNISNVPITHIQLPRCFRRRLTPVGFINHTRQSLWVLKPAGSWVTDFTSRTARPQ